MKKVDAKNRLLSASAGFLLDFLLDPKEKVIFCSETPDC
jgi:hypothetical protein